MKQDLQEIPIQKLADDLSEKDKLSKLLSQLEMEQKVDVKKNQSKKHKNRSIKKLIYGYQVFIAERAKQNSILHPIEKLFLENQRIKICKKEDKVVVFKLSQKFFKKKGNTQYKSERDPNELPLDFSSSHGMPTKVSKQVFKYYKNRYYLFSKFDEGIQLDEESNAENNSRLVFSNTRGGSLVHSKEVQGRVCVRWIWRSRREYYSGTLGV